MIAIDLERCTGCGACVEVCPTGALRLVGGKATVDQSLCRECEACLAACPTEAIILVTQEAPVVEKTHLPAVRPQPEVIQVRTSPVPVSLRSQVLPVVGTALVWVGREILPWLADSVLDTLSRYTIRLPARGAERDRKAPASAGRGGRRQRRQRRRGGGGWS
ncbi:MAG: 4Fe-4S binding protein [Anaerolineae bacterium]|nr:4Fe-4S binding protein [Anaerolineae bacterium]